LLREISKHQDTVEKRERAFGSEKTSVAVCVSVVNRSLTDDGSSLWKTVYFHHFDSSPSTGIFAHAKIIANLSIFVSMQKGLMLGWIYIFHLCAKEALRRS